MPSVTDMQRRIDRQNEVIAGLRKQVFELQKVVENFSSVVDSVKSDTLKLMAANSISCNGGRGCRLASKMLVDLKIQ